MMFRYVQLRWKISQLERKRAVERARARNAPPDPHEIDGIGGSSEGVLLYNIRELLSDYLISEAHRLFIPLPDWDKQSWLPRHGQICTYSGRDQRASIGHSRGEKSSGRAVLNVGARYSRNTWSGNRSGLNLD